MKTAEESLGISSKEYNDILDKCLYGESEPADKVEPKFKVGVIFYRYEKGRFTENDGWHKYDRSLIVDRIRKQDESVTYKALIRGDLEDNPLIWHELDLTKSRLFHKQLTIFDAINEAQK